MTNLFKKQRKQSSLAAVALLSILLGVQGAIVAVADSSMPFSFNYGFNIGTSAESRDPADAGATIVNACTAEFGYSTLATSDYNECKYGGYEGAIAVININYSQ